MVSIKKKSKRQTTRLRAKIEKKAREHRRKERKASKKKPSFQKQKRKDPGIPSSLPFKEKVLKDAEEWKKKKEEDRLKEQERRKRERQKLLDKKRNLDTLVKDAQKKTTEYERKKAVLTGSSNYTGGKSVENSLKTFYKEFRKVVDAADVVLEVLDARDPLGSRCQQMEEAIISSSTDKRLVLVLNKIDLVPRENVAAWLKHLKNEFPVVAFKASTQTQNDNLCQTKVPLSQIHKSLLKSSHCLGADVLMKLLNNYCRNKEVKSVIRVGVVGFPNTGKSSIINSLKRSKACNVGALPGITKQMQEVHLDKHIKLLDSPGVVMATGNSDASTILRNCVRLENLDDVFEPVGAILKRCNKDQLLLHYKMTDYNDTNEFLSQLARLHGRLKKGGIPDVRRAAKSVLQDWNTGRITYYTHPPEQSSLSTHISSEIVTRMSQEFDIDALADEQLSVIKGLKEKNSKHILVESLGPLPMVMEERDLKTENANMAEEEEDEDEEEEMVEEEDEEEEDVEEMDDDERKEEGTELQNTTVLMTESRRKSRKSSESKGQGQEVSATSSKAKLNPGLPQLNKIRKKEFKKMKKDRRRRDKVASVLSDALTSALSTKTADAGMEDDSYDFNAFFS